MNKYLPEYTSLFLEKYRELERIKSVDEERYNRFRNTNMQIFELFRQARNCLTHTPKLNGDYPLLVSKDVLDALETYIKKMSLKVVDVAKPISKLKTLDINSPIKDALKLMKDNDFSHIPIFDKDHHLLHVVSERSIVSLLADTGIVYDETTLLSEYKQYFVVANNKEEVYEYIARNSYAYEAKDIFNKYAEKGLKCGAIFVTENGKKEESVIAMLTSWDVFEI